MIKDNLAPRISHQTFGQLYFWTATIRAWRPLLFGDHYKDIIVGSMKNLSDRRLVDIYGFVIMPNHMHLVRASQ